MDDHQASMVGPGGVDVRRSLAYGGGMVAPAIMTVNVAGYVLAVAAARVLDPGGYGELNALLGALLIASVPALALQAVVAQAIARRPTGEVAGPREQALLLRAAMVGGAVTVGAVVAAPLLTLFLHVGVAGPLWLAAGLLPLAVLSGVMGLLQGAERFGALALLLLAQAAGKALGLVPLLFHRGAPSVLAALAAGTALTALFGLAFAVPRHRAVAVEPLEGLPGSRGLLRAMNGLLALLVLANLDVLLARHVLPSDASGRYSVGAVCAKVALWLPQAVVVVVFPRLSEPGSGGTLLRRAVRLLLSLSVLEIAGALLLARPVIELAFGAGYRSVAPLAPLFVVQGATLALVQLLVYRGIATADPLPARLVVAAAAVEACVVLVLRPGSPLPVILVATLVAVPLAGALLGSTAATDRKRRTK
jgi:O-antigen/teichoic acid export membrane protein